MEDIPVQKAWTDAVPSVAPLLTREETKNARTPRDRARSVELCSNNLLMNGEVRALRSLMRAARKSLAGVEVPKDAEYAPMSVQEASYVWINLLCNYGLFSAPFLFAQNGLAALGAILAAVIVCMICAILLIEVLQNAVDSGVHHPAYGELASIAVGRSFSQLMTLTAPLECFTYGLGNCLIVVNMFAKVLPGISKSSLILASCGFAIAQSSIPDNIYAYFLLGGSLCITGVCILVIASGVVLPTWAEEFALIKSEGAILPRCMSTCMFAVAAHCCVPMIFNGVGGDKEKCLKAVGRGYIAYFVFCSVFGMAGYYIYGRSAEVVATANVGFDLSLKPNATSRIFLIPTYILTLARCQLAQVPIGRPAADLVNGAIFGSQIPTGRGGLQAVLSSTPVFMAMALGAYFLMDSLASLESVAGATLMNLNGFVFPGLVYIKMGAMVGFKKVLAPSAVGLGIFLSLYVCSQELFK